MLRAVLNKSWRQHPMRLQLYGHLPPITKTIQVRQTRHAGHCWRSKDELISDVLLWTPTHGCARVGRPARTYIQQLCEDTGCNPEDLLEAMNDRRNGERRSGISAQAAQHDDDDDLSLPDIGMMVTVFTNGPGDLGSIPVRVIPKIQKMVLDASLLNTQHYKIWIKSKVEQSRERNSPPTHTHTPWCCSYRKGAFWSLLTKVANFTYIFIVMPFLLVTELNSLLQHWAITNTYIHRPQSLKMIGMLDFLQHQTNF